MQITCEQLKSVPAATYSWFVAEGIVDDDQVELRLDERINMDPFGK